MLVAELKQLKADILQATDVCVPSTTNGPGTLTALENLIDCARKGCYTDPLPVEKMYIRVGIGPETRLNLYALKGMTAKNEATHRPYNAAFDESTQLGDNIFHARTALFVAQRNEAADRKLGRRDAHSYLPWWKEVRANSLAAKAGVPVPYPVRMQRRQEQPAAARDGREREVFGNNFYRVHYKNEKLDHVLSGASRLAEIEQLERSIDADLCSGAAPTAEPLPTFTGDSTIVGTGARPVDITSPVSQLWSPGDGSALGLDASTVCAARCAAPHARAHASCKRLARRATPPCTTRSLTVPATRRAHRPRSTRLRLRPLAQESSPRPRPSA